MNSVYFKPTYLIKFLEENGSHFAVAQFEIYKTRWCDELLFAEVTSENLVIWQDDWQNPVPFETFYQAERYIRENYLQHQPLVNGNTYPVKQSLPIRNR